DAQKADSGCATQLFRGPKSFTGKGLPGLMVNQTDQVQLVGHGGELPANGLQSEKETAVVHDRNFAVETSRRTMNFQRAAECVLTGCLSPGGRFSHPDQCKERRILKSHDDPRLRYNHRTLQPRS